MDSKYDRQVIAENASVASEPVAGKLAARVLAGRTRSAAIAATLCGLMLTSFSGCRLCSDSEDLAYPTYGGAWQRTVRDRGRVGSIFDPAGARSATLVSRDSTESVDELQRRLHVPSETDDRPDDMFEDEREAEQSNDAPSPRQSLDDEGGLGDDDTDQKLEEKKRKLRDSDFESIKVIEGEPLPPLLR